jgi:hypothetical protein
MTHSAYRRRIARAVYLLRDGRDCLVSLYHYTTTREGLALDFDTWLSRYRAGLYGPRWDQNVVSWLKRGATRLGKELLVVRYEDLRSNPTAVLAGVCRFLGIPTDERVLERAVELSTLERGRSWERQRGDEPGVPDASFYRRGGSGEWREALTEDQQREFLAMSGHALRLAGYLTGRPGQPYP